jgi:ABC-type phosphonate transport system ATPase subunit
MMASRFEVPAENLAWRCDLSFLPFTCTAEMTPLEDFIGQDRAIRAIEFGLGVSKPGFNIFVTGLTGTGKTSIIKAFLKKATAKQAAPALDAAKPEDWCYVYNFTDADRPQALRTRRGWGKVSSPIWNSSCKICSARRKRCLRAMSTCANARR